MTSAQPAKSALLLIDVINPFDFDGAEQLLEYALPAARCLAALKARLSKKGAPVIYVNDNFGRWRSDFREQFNHCRATGAGAASVCDLLKPAADDYFVLKPRHSGFYSTPLEVLLQELKVRRLIVAGFTTDICVLYTANDAYMRDYGLVIPSDCVASETQRSNQLSLDHMKSKLKARVLPSGRILP